MLAEDVRPQLDELARRPRVRGVRMQLHWHENLLYRFASGPELARDERLKANVARLGQYGWSVRPAGLRIPDGRRAELAAACPDVTFVLQHAGMLEDLSRRASRLARRHEAARGAG